MKHLVDFKSMVRKRLQISVSDWDKLVTQTYGKPYSFQQQDGCQPRGTFTITIPSEYTIEDELSDEIPLEINGDEMGVKFETWLNTDPETHKQKMGWSDWQVNLFWDRNFYPDINTLVNDLHERGIVDEGEYDIKIDW